MYILWPILSITVTLILIQYSHQLEAHLTVHTEDDQNELTRPAPFSPDFSPECALIVTQEYPDVNVPSIKLSPGLEYFTSYAPSIKRAAYYPYHGQICVRYDDINLAINEAKVQLGVYIPPSIFDLSSDSPKPKEIAYAAEVLILASKLIGQWYKLTREAILFGLPRIDTSKTAVQGLCPTFLKPVKCEIDKYRTLTGMCNNLNHPSWGAARTAMVRFMAPAYADGVSEPRTSVVPNEKLPNARIVSFILHHDISERDLKTTTLVVGFGQMIDHDMMMAVASADETGNDIKCCEYPQEVRHQMCIPVEIPPNDPFFKYFKRRCMDMVRILPGIKSGCLLGPRTQMNAISSFLDGSHIYGSTQEVAARMREFKGGLLKTTPLYKDLGFKDLLPIKVHDPDNGCERKGRPRNMYCFDAGDERVNEQILLTMMHTLFLREHNRIAEYLGYTNQHWDDERIYQETRRIIAAEIQHITFNEFLPVILGRIAMHKYGLDLVEKGYFKGYDPKTNPGVRLAFQAAAYRFGHSLLPDVVERYNKFHKKLEAIRLSQLLKQPYEMYKPGAVDTLLLGMVDQEANRVDPQITTEVTNHLFEKPGEHFGLDLAAINIQRAREVGLPGYNKFREYCGLPRFESFHDMIGSFDNLTVQRMSKIYSDIDDVDLWSAGISEFPIYGGLLGPVMTCLIAEQFASNRRGDRFWYENEGWPSQFTLPQLEEIRKIKMARLICDNSDEIETIQLYPFLQADPLTNPRVKCTELPYMDLSVFNEIPYVASAKA